MGRVGVQQTYILWTALGPIYTPLRFFSSAFSPDCSAQNI